MRGPGRSRLPAGGTVSLDGFPRLCTRAWSWPTRSCASRRRQAPYGRSGRSSIQPHGCALDRGSGGREEGDAPGPAGRARRRTRGDRGGTATGAAPRRNRDGHAPSRRRLRRSIPPRRTSVVCNRRGACVALARGLAQGTAVGGHPSREKVFPLWRFVFQTCRRQGHRPIAERECPRNDKDTFVFDTGALSL